MANEVENTQPTVTDEQIKNALETLIKFHNERQGALVILSGLGGTIHMSGNRFEVEKLMDWQLTELAKSNAEFLTTKFTVKPAAPEASGATNEASA